MITEKILITSNGIRNSLKKYTSLQALAEFLWNGFDAQAHNIKIEINENAMKLGGIDLIKIIDDGSGINYEQLETKFKPFFQSEKIYDPNVKKSDVHGKNGVGRLTFFTFANSAKWHTIYSVGSSNKSYDITVEADKLNSYDANEPMDSTEKTGTIVEFLAIIDTELVIDEIANFLSKEFCWYLELFDGKKTIKINDNLLDYSGLIQDTHTEKITYSETGMEFFIKIVCWNQKLNEYSKYYYINNEGIERAKENTTFNNKGDKFYHSVFITSILFNNFVLSDDFDCIQTSTFEPYSKASAEFRFVKSAVNKILYDKRRPFLRNHVSEVINKLEIDSAFPKSDINNPIYKFRKLQIEELIEHLYIAQPKIFSSLMNKEQKKTFIRLIDLIMENGEIANLFSIFDEILDMDNSERAELSNILKYTKLSNIVKTTKLLKDRNQAVSDFKQLVFKTDLNANEVNHVQSMVENHYWIFGEQYNLVTSAEPNFEEALRRYMYHLHKEYDEVTCDHPDKYKQMDVFAVRQDIANNKYNNIVVELKHPQINLGEKQLSQVKNYMRVIKSIDQFNAPNMTWDFYLVGNKFSSTKYIESEIANNKHHGEASLVFNVENYKIYVKTWSQIFAEFEMRHKYLNDKLCLQSDRLSKSYSSADEIILNQCANIAISPKEITAQ